MNTWIAGKNLMKHMLTTNMLKEYGKISEHKSRSILCSMRAE